MKDNEQNPMLLYYITHNISPVKQDISDLKKHFLRRERLYRLLGLPPIIFSNSSILEIGPGGGYNSLAFFYWGANVDFVEPNPKAHEEISLLLEREGIDKNRWNLYKEKVETLELTKKYDIVIAEGFLPVLNNRLEVIKKISTIVNPGGVIVITCTDDISFFFEHIRQMIARRLIQRTNTFDEKIKILCRAFSTHLESLKFSSRSIEDWVTDSFLSPWPYNTSFSISDCIIEFGDDFNFLSSSPKMFTDYSWYKDIEFNSKKDLLDQFCRKQHMLILTNLQETLRNPEENYALFENVSHLRNVTVKYWNNPCDKEIIEEIKILKIIYQQTKTIDFRISNAINEAIELLSKDDLTEFDVANSKELNKSFGMGQQYISMVKRL